MRIHVSPSRQPYPAGAAAGSLGMSEPIIELAAADGSGFTEGIGLAGIVGRGA